MFGISTWFSVYVSIIWSHINLAVIRRLLGPPFHQSPTQQLGLTSFCRFASTKWKRKFRLQGQKPAGFSDFCEVDELMVHCFFFEIPAELSWRTLQDAGLTPSATLFVGYEATVSGAVRMDISWHLEFMTIGPWILVCSGTIETVSIIFTRKNANISPVFTCQIGPCYFSIPVRTHSPLTKSKRCATDELRWPWHFWAICTYAICCNLLKFHPLAPKTLHFHDVAFFSSKSPCALGTGCCPGFGQVAVISLIFWALSFCWIYTGTFEEQQGSDLLKDSTMLQSAPHFLQILYTALQFTSSSMTCGHHLTFAGIIACCPTYSLYS